MCLLRFRRCNYGLAIPGVEEQLYLAYRPTVHVSIGPKRQSGGLLVGRPTLLNAVAGLLTILINLYTARDGNWSIMALLAIIAAGLSAACSLALVVIYKFGKLEKVKREHDLEVNAGFRRVSP